MHLIINNKTPEDLVVATGVTHSVRDMTDYVFKKLDLDTKKYITQNAKYLRPQELKYLKGDSTKLREKFNWKPEYTFETLLDEMIDFWLESYK